MYIKSIFIINTVQTQLVKHHPGCVNMRKKLWKKISFPALQYFSKIQNKR
jgi:hypothetical protein